MKHHLIVAFVLMICAGPVSGSAEDFAVRAPATRTLTRPDSSGDVWYAVKLPVANKTASYLLVMFELQAVDKDGFELETVTLTGVIHPSSSDFLTDKTYMSHAHYISIAKWQITDSRKREIERPTTTVSGIATRLQSQPDSSGDVWYAIKADIANAGHRSLRGVELQAVDKDGFEIDSVTLSGNISPGKTTTLTEKTFMPYSDFKRIAEWRFAGD
jgi:hypothetical protein